MRGTHVVGLTFSDKDFEMVREKERERKKRERGDVRGAEKSVNKFVRVPFTVNQVL